MDSALGQALDQFRQVTLVEKPPKLQREVPRTGESRFAGYWEHNLEPGKRIWITSLPHLEREMKRCNRLPADDLFKKAGHPMKWRQSKLEQNRISDQIWKMREQIIHQER